MDPVWEAEIFRQFTPEPSSSVSLIDVTVSDSLQDGIQIEGTSTPVLNRVTVTGSGGVAFDVAPTANPNFSNLAATDNGTDAVRILAGTITGTRTYDVTDLAYVFTGDVTVAAGADLTIAPGAVLKFGAGNLFIVSAGANLDAQGTAANPVIFTSRQDDSALGSIGNGPTTGAAGDWEALFIDGDGSLEFVEVRFAGDFNGPAFGGGQTASLFVRGSSTVSLTDVTVRDAAEDGIRIEGASAPVLRRVTVRDVGGIGFSIGATSTPDLNGVTALRAAGAAFFVEQAANPSLLNLTATDNGSDGILIAGGALVGDRTYNITNLPYFFSGDLTVASGRTLTLVAGAVLKFNDGQLFLVADGGTLIARGTVARPIIITSREDDSALGDLGGGATSGTDGDWEALYIDGAATLEFAEVRFAGDFNGSGFGGGDTASVFFRGSTTASLSDVKVLDGRATGIEFQGTSAPVLNRVTVARVRGVAFDVLNTTSPDINNPIVTDNGTDAIQIRSGGLAGNRTYDVTNVSYIFDSNLTVASGQTLTLTAGVVFKFGAGHILFVADGGTLNAQGTSARPVLFTSRTDGTALGDIGSSATVGAPGDWEALIIDGDATLEFVEVRFAGDFNGPGFGGGDTPAVQVRGSSPVLTNFLVSDVLDDGIAFTGAAAPVVNSATVRRAGRVAYELSQTVDFDHRQLSGFANEVNAINIEGGDLGGTPEVERTYNNTALPYIFTNNLIVQTGDKLTLAPGVVLKISDGLTLDVRGTLDAQGTVAQPIIFTHRRDDAAGGDTFNDLDTLNDADRFNWEALYLREGSDASVLRNVEVRYAGDNNGAFGSGFVPAVDISGTDPTLENVRVRDVVDDGFRIVSGSNPTLLGVDVQRAVGIPFTISQDSDFDHAEISASDNGIDAINIEGGDLGGTPEVERTYNNTALPYIFTNNLIVQTGDKLTLAPGVVLKISDGLTLDVRGTLDAQGTVAQPIIFTHRRDDAAGGDTFNDLDTLNDADRFNWEALYLREGSDASVLRNVEVRYAGDNNGAFGSGFVPAVDISGTDPTLENVRVRDVVDDGFRIVSGSNPTILGVDVQRAVGIPFTISQDSDFDHAEISASDNGIDAINIEGGDLGGTPEVERTYNNTALPYIFTNNLIVQTGDKLTLAPGVVLKISDGQTLDVRGTLDAEGTVAQPIIFTHRRDDAAGGDTFNDLDTLNDADRFNWEALFLREGSDASVLRNIEVRYAGDNNGAFGGGFVPAVQVSGNNTAEDIRVIASAGGGISVGSGGSLGLNGGLVRGSGSSGISVVE